MSIIFALYLLLFGNLLSAQTFIQNGNLKVGLKVTKNSRLIPIDSLCQGFNPVTNAPINFIVPEDCVLEFMKDTIKADGGIILLLNNTEPKYINRPIQKEDGIGMGRSAGSRNSYTFIDKKNKDSLKIEWKIGYVRPQLLDLLPASYFNDYISHTFKNTFEEYSDSIQYDWSKEAPIQKLDQYGFPIAPSLPYNYEGLFFVMYVTETAVVQMKGHHDNFHKVDINNPFDLFLYEDLKPGTYEFIVKPYEDAPESLWFKYPFTIEKPWWQQTETKAILVGTIIILFALAIFFYVLAAQKRKEKELRLKQQITDAELKAIRAQLNPHFLFNSLSSIQNLVTQQKNEEANLYIAKLSRLLRQVLSSSERQFQELEDEIKLIQLYLEIEQLRFPFTSNIEVDDSISKNTLVPVMLLQPYVENAVKHGVAGNPEGEINIRIKKQNQTLYIEIIDNGPGFSTPHSDSKGLVLGNNWINHLNNLYSDEASVEIKNRTSTNGVIVKINLPIE